MGHRSRMTPLLLAMVIVMACGGGQARWAFPTGVPARPDPCKVAVTRLAGFTERLTGDLVLLREFLVADEFDSYATSRGIKGVSASLTAYADLPQVAQACEATADLVPRAEALEASAASATRPSLNAWIGEGEIHWLAAYKLVGLLPETLSLSEAAKAAGDQLSVDVTAAADPAGSSPPVIPLGPFVTSTPDYQAFADRVVRRGAEFSYLVDSELANLAAGGGEARRIGHRLVTFADTEIKWLKAHEPEACYRQFWRAVMADWSDIKSAGGHMVDVSTDSAIRSLKKARNHLATLMDRDYISEANQNCVTAPGRNP